MLVPRFPSLLKYGLFIIVFCGIFMIILPLMRLKRELSLGASFEELKKPTNLFLKAKFTWDLLHEGAPHCLRRLKFGYESVKTRNLVFLEMETSSHKNKGFYKLFLEFNSILKASQLKVAVIEPSVLFCMLKDDYRNLLRKRNFNMTKFQGSPDVLTFGIRQDDAYELLQKDVVSKFTEAGFKSFYTHTNLTNWMHKKKSLLLIKKPLGHVFYVHGNHTFHLVVLYERQNFYWHASASTGDLGKIRTTEWLFTSDNSAYDKFSFVPVLFEKARVASTRFYIPSSPHSFLFQMLSSKFLECDLSRAANVTQDSPKSHYSLSAEEFNLRTIVAIQQLKAIFQPLLLNLWIFAGTMLGWYRQCDIIPYTSDTDFGAWADEVQDLNAIIDPLRNNSYINIKFRMGILEEALEFELNCKGLRVDIFFMYRKGNGSWCAGHKPSQKYYFRYFYPSFSICSAELLGEKVQVPCETEDVILNDYGSDWSTPKSSWNYLTSFKHRGPNIYWKKESLNDVYEHY